MRNASQTLNKVFRNADGSLSTVCRNASQTLNAVFDSGSNSLKVNHTFPETEEASKVVVTDENGNLDTSDITTTELDYLDGASSNIQEQINAKAANATVTDNFGGILSSADDTIQKALDTIDDITIDNIPQGVTTDTEQEITAVKDFSGGIKADTISESTAGAGVTIDSLKIKDGYIDGNLGVGAASAGEKLEIGKDTDVIGIIGRAKIGYDGTNTDYAAFAHIDNMSSTKYAFRQSSSGLTVEFNTPTGGSLYFKQNNSEIMRANATGLTGVASKSLSFDIITSKYFNTIFSSDADSDTDDILATGIASKFALVLIAEKTTNKFGLFRIKGDNSAPVIIDADAEFTITKDTASSFNFYYETDQYKLQNKVGDNQALYVGLYTV